MIADSIWTMFTSMPWPKAEVAYCESCITEADGGATVDSPATSMPLGFVNPKAWRYL